MSGIVCSATPIVVPCGVGSSDAPLPALEDLIDAGAVLHALELRLSPEAEIAHLTFLGTRHQLPEIVHASVSGQELIGRGYAEDVEAAITYNVSTTAPLLQNGAYSNTG